MRRTPALPVRLSRPAARAAVLVSATVAAVVLAWTNPALAATPSAPSALATESVESQTPIMAATVADPDGGTVTGKFYARTPGSTTWNLVNGASSAGITSGQRARYKLPVSYRIGASFEWAVQACDAATCSAISATQTGTVSPMLGAGPRPNATRLSFGLGDRVQAQVDVGSGNLLVTTTEIALPGGVGIGVAYNSVALGTAHEVGYPGPGWRMRVGADVKLLENPDGSVTYLGPDGVTGLFFLKSGSTTTYAAPVGFKADLVKTGTTGWTLTSRGGTKGVFTATGQLDYVDDRNVQRTNFTYNIGGKLTQVVSSLGSTNQRTVNIVPNSTGQVGTLGQTASGGSTVQRQVAYGYSTASDLTSILDVEGRTTTFGYNAAHELTSITNTGGAVTRFTYDTSHRVTSVKQENPATGSPGDSITRLSYDTPSQTQVAGPNTDQTQAVLAVPRTTYNLNNYGDLRVASAVDPAGNTRSKTYTPFADSATTTSPAGTTTFGYDPAVNGGESRTSTTSATGASTSATYANTGSVSKYVPSSTTGAQGESSTYTFDGAGNALSAANAMAAEAKVTYNADGTVATSTDPGNGTNSTTYGYNAATHQLTGVTPPTGTTLGARSFTYDLFGRVGTSTSGRGVTTTYGYNKLDRPTSVTYSDGPPSVTYGYDTTGRLQTRAGATGITTFGYDPLNRLTSRAAASSGGTLRYGYDKASNLTRVTDARGSTTYTYDTRNLVASMTTAAGTVLRYAHNASGKRTDTWFATNATNTVWAAHTHIDYDASNRLSRTWTSRNSNNATRAYDRSYCRSKYISAACPTASATTDTALIHWSTNNLTTDRTTYTYDRADRLTSAVLTSGGATTFTNTYTYDARGNRLTAGNNGATPTQTLTYNPGNQITTTGYAHDGSGNRTADPDAGALTYNGSEQMTGVQGAIPSDTTVYTYAGTDQNELVEVNKGTNRQVSKFVYGRSDRNGLPIVQSLTHTDIRYTPASVQVYIDHDPGGTPQVLTTDTGVQVFYVFDGNIGSPVALIDTAGTVYRSYQYDPYGAYSDDTSTTSGPDINPFRTAAGLRDFSTGWIKFGQRWYDPTTGRFTQQDSIEFLTDPARGNRYAYAGDNPVNYVDPTGRDYDVTISNDVIVYGLLTGSLVTGVAAIVSSGAALGVASLVLAYGSGVFSQNKCSLTVEVNEGIFEIGENSFLDNARLTGCE